MLTDKKGILSRIDPMSNKVAAEIAVTPNSAACIYAEGAIWITTPEKKLLTRVDAKTNQVTDTIEVGPGPRFLTAGAGSIWTLNQGDGTVSRVDAKTASLSRISKRGFPAAAARSRSERDMCGRRCFRFRSRRSILRRTRWSSNGSVRAAIRFASGTDRCGSRIYAIRMSGDLKSINSRIMTTETECNARVVRR